MIKIPDYELHYFFSRSSGKGGQNVNKVESRVQLRWNIYHSSVLSDEDRQLIINKLKNRLNSKGEILVVCDEKRAQGANLAIAKHKLAFLVQNALKRAKKRLKTRPTKASRLKRLENKRKISQKKQNRRISNEY